MTTQDVDSGFEALLKPLQDITSKVWDIVLTKALENYLVHTNDTTFVNFTEAAVLVQNSASFYCKRVDLVHLGCQQFVEQLTDLGKENGEVDGQPIKKKRTVKTYISNDFEPMELLFSDCNIDVNLEKIDKNLDKRKIILNKYPKVTRKPNTSCPVYQTKGAEMGLKEEFRLHWGISSNGVLNEDFFTARNSMLLNWCSLSDELREVLCNSASPLENDSMDLDFETCDDIHKQVISPTPFPDPSPDSCDSPVHQNSPLPTENIPVEAHPIKDPYKELTFNFAIPSRSLIKKQSFSLSKALIGEVNDWKARKIEKKEQSKDPNYMFDSFFDFLKHRILLQERSGCQEKMAQSAKQRRREILLRQKYYERAAAKAGHEYVEDFNGYDVQYEDNNAGDIDIDDVDDLVQVDIPDNIQTNNETYAQDKEAMMTAYQENKRRNAAEMTEVARRVQEWHESLAHVLDMAESRAQFDVHDYGTRIIASFNESPEKQPILPFERIVQNESRPEISRFLLSSLMLANTYNVEIIKEKGDLVKDCLKLKLLSVVRHHEEMDENLAAHH